MMTLSPEDNLRKDDTIRFPCITCKDSLVLNSVPHNATIKDYEASVEKGYWRFGKWLYPACERCPQRHVRMKTMNFMNEYFQKEDLAKNVLTAVPGHIRGSSYRKIYKNLKITFLTAKELHEDILSVCEEYETEVLNGPKFDRESFEKFNCNSLIGHVPSETLERYNAGDFTNVATGSMFTVITLEEKPVIVLLFDICDTWAGFKRFWYRNPIPDQKINKPRLTKLCMLKSFEVAYHLNKPYSYLSYFDPLNTRLAYKLHYSELLEINAHNKGKWTLIEEIVELDKDHNIKDVNKYTDYILEGTKTR